LPCQSLLGRQEGLAQQTERAGDVGTEGVARQVAEAGNESGRGRKCRQRGQATQAQEANNTGGRRPGRQARKMTMTGRGQATQQGIAGSSKPGTCSSCTQIPKTT